MISDVVESRKRELVPSGVIGQAAATELAQLYCLVENRFTPDQLLVLTERALMMSQIAGGALTGSDKFRDSDPRLGRPVAVARIERFNLLTGQVIFSSRPELSPDNPLQPILELNGVVVVQPDGSSLTVNAQLPLVDLIQQIGAPNYPFMAGAQEWPQDLPIQLSYRQLPRFDSGGVNSVITLNISGPLAAQFYRLADTSGQIRDRQKVVCFFMSPEGVDPHEMSYAVFITFCIDLLRKVAQQSTDLDRIVYQYPAIGAMGGEAPNGRHERLDGGRVWSSIKALLFGIGNAFNAIDWGGDDPRLGQIRQCARAVLRYWENQRQISPDGAISGRNRRLVDQPRLGTGELVLLPELRPIADVLSAYDLRDPENIGAMERLVDALKQNYFNVYLKRVVHDRGLDAALQMFKAAMSMQLLALHLLDRNYAGGIKKRSAVQLPPWYEAMSLQERKTVMQLLQQWGYCGKSIKTTHLDRLCRLAGSGEMQLVNPKVIDQLKTYAVYLNWELVLAAQSLLALCSILFPNSEPENAQLMDWLHTRVNIAQSHTYGLPAGLSNHLAVVGRSRVLSEQHRGAILTAGRSL